MEIIDKSSLNYSEILSLVKKDDISENDFFSILTEFAIQNKLSRKEILGIIVIIMRTENLADNSLDFIGNYYDLLYGNCQKKVIIKLFKDSENHEELVEFVNSRAYEILEFYTPNWRNLEYKKNNKFWINYPYYKLEEVNVIETDKTSTIVRL